ncbi:MAG: hypothetical protein WC061_09280, partial [Melioribacteraceae bacterium]
MKKAIIFIFVILFIVTLSAQERKTIDVPEKTRTLLANLYPEAKNVAWLKDFDMIHASFLVEGKQVRVIFRADSLYAKMIETEISAIPEAVKNHISKNYKGYSIFRAGKIHYASVPDKNNLCYGADITNGSVTKRIVCYPNGTEMSVATLPD